VADLARRTLEQDALRLSIQETLATVANSPSTLQTLNDLFQKLITHERTEEDLINLLVHAVNTPQVQKALLGLLEVVLQDPNVQKLSFEFLLKGLDIESVKKMLDAQTQELVRTTVHDDSVQQAAAVGIQRSLWYAITPRVLWRYIVHANDGSDASVSSIEDTCEKTAAIRIEVSATRPTSLVNDGSEKGEALPPGVFGIKGQSQ
jgi:predicted NACHT family NTPase